MASILFLITFILLVGLGLWYAFKYGAISAYIKFAWLIPLAGIYWWNYELDLFNEKFVLTLIGFSFVLSIICLPLLMITNWRNLSILKFLGLTISAFFHGIPFLVYLLLNIFPPK